MLVIVRYDLPNRSGTAIRFTVIRHLPMIFIDDELSLFLRSSVVDHVYENPSGEAQERHFTKFLWNKAGTYCFGANVIDVQRLKWCRKIS